VVSIAAFFINYADEVAGYSDSKSAKLLSAALGLFSLGRFIGAFCMKWIDARYILAAFVSMLVILSALASGLGGVGGISLYMTLFFFERYTIRRFSD
jgi:FHS family L-fucose permease-like MFS transporter